MAAKTKVYFVLDDSYSITDAGIVMDVHEALNRNMKDISDNAIETDDDVTISLSLFGEIIDEKFFNVPAKHVRTLARYDPRQSATKLFQATKEAILRLEELDKKEGPDCAFLLMVVTDGHNNNFRVTADELKRHIDRVQKTGRWTLVFMLPPRSKASFCRQFKIPEGNVAEWEQSRKGVAQVQAAQTQGITNFLKARRAGQMSTGKFYSDMTTVSSQDVQQVLDDIASDCQILNVGKKERIDTFCRREAGRYTKGCAFYQLVKTEEIQAYKKIIIREKGKQAIYYGPHARDLLGLPDSKVKVVPGNHANFVIFVQSTADNRATDPSTQIVYYPRATIDK